MAALEWILIYSTVPITFHIITNTDSISYVERIFQKVNETANCEFDQEIITLAQLMEYTSNNICPKMTVSEDFCDILMGKRKGASQEYVVFIPHRSVCRWLRFRRRCSNFHVAFF